MRSDARVLTEAEIDLALTLAYDNRPIVKIAELLGFVNIRSFYEYRQRHPEFSKSLELARVNGAELLEDRLLAVNEEYTDPKQARVLLEALGKALQFRNPAKYGPKLDISVTQTIDISGSIDRMNQRLDATYRDVTPLIANTSEIKDLW